MAKSAAYRWQNERRGGLLGPPKKKGKGKKRGITNAQAKYLAALQRGLGEPFTGGGMTMGQASAAIDDCKRRVRKKRQELDSGLDGALERDAA